MQKVRLHPLAGSVQPAHNGKASIPLSQGGELLPASYPLSVTPHTAYAPGTLPPAPPVNLKNASGVSSPSPSILAVDDSQTIRKIIEVTLRRERYVVNTFPDGIAAFRWLAERRGPVPQLILLDIELPKMDGYAIARALKAKPALENATIIMMSCREGVSDRLKGRLVGAKEYLTKPFTTEELMETVRQYLGNETGGMFGSSSALDF